MLETGLPFTRRFLPRVLATSACVLALGCRTKSDPRATATNTTDATDATNTTNTPDAPPATNTPPAPDATPPSASDTPVTCTATTSPSTTIVATFALSTMTGTLSIDGTSTAGPRRMRVKAAPHAATYSLVFLGYAPGDQKPAAEKLVIGKSVVARLVTISGEGLRLYLDSDFHPAMALPSAGFLPCREAP